MCLNSIKINHGFCPRARKGNTHSATLEQSNNTTSPMPRMGLGRGVRLLYTKDTSCIRVYFMVSGLLVSGLWSLVSGLLVSWSLGLLVSGLWSLVSGLYRPLHLFLFFNIIVCGNWISLPKSNLPMYICVVNIIPKL